MDTLPNLLASVQAGDLNSYEDVVRRFQDMAVGYSYSRLGDFHHTEVAEAMEAWRTKSSGETDAGIALCNAARRGSVEEVREMLKADLSGIHATDLCH